VVFQLGVGVGRRRVIDQWSLDIEFLSAYFENEKPVSPPTSSFSHRLHVFFFNSYESPRSTVQSMIDIVCVRFKQPLTLLLCLVKSIDAKRDALYISAINLK
jgi:hypothetical protein